jgi:UDP-4-amino-4-deoxy-L-arabinose-oxoglutarate aminotransferase
LSARVEFYRHNLGPDEIASVTKVLESLFLSTGPVVRDFEDQFAAYLGTPHAVGLTSCTAALHLALLAHDIGPGDEVVTTPMTFVATANAILHTGARPVFVDVEPETGNLDAARVEDAITPRTRAILPVHLYGQMCDMRALRGIADRRGLVVVEDAAHALEAERDGVRPGQLAEAACFSFYATKSITSGEGGAVSTASATVADQIRKLRLHGMDLSAADRYTKRYQHWDLEYCGWKYNMDNIQAALLIPQIGRIEERWKRREAISRRYEAAFSNVPGLEFPKVVTGSKSARHLFTIWVAPERRDEILWKLQDKDIGVGVNYRAIHLLRFYRAVLASSEGMFPVAESIGQRTISLPLYPMLTDAEVEQVIHAVTTVAR